MKKSRKNELLGIISFLEENIKTEEMIELITNEIIKKGGKSLPCYAQGGYHNDEQVTEVQFLRVGLKKESGLEHWGDKDKNVLCVVGAVGPCIGDNVDNVIRITVKFNMLPYYVQLRIFATCLQKGFKYPFCGRTPNTLFSKKNIDFEKLEPIFKECYFADYDNCAYKIQFTNSFSSDGRAIFAYNDKNGKLKEKHIPEEGLYRLSHGGVLHWGFDYAFSLDKEKLRSCCRGGFKKDYSELDNENIQQHVLTDFELATCSTK